MSAPSDDDSGAQRQVPRSRLRLLLIGLVIVILVVVFGYLLLVGNLR
jgi:hypothetical protein